MIRLALLWLATGSLFAYAGRIDECFLALDHIGHTLEADYEFTQHLIDTGDLVEEYLGTKAHPTQAQWTARNRGRGNRSFRGSFSDEKKLQDAFFADRQKAIADPKSKELHRAMAERAVTILERTGVPARLEEPLGEAIDYTVVVEPMTSAEWRTWARNRFNEKGGTAPVLTLVAERARRRGRRVTFSTSDLLLEKGGSFHDGRNISLGIPEMFSLRLAGTNVHEHGHDEGASRVMEWWSPTEARKLGNARAWLPYVEIFNDKKSGELKSTPYETSFLIEEVECCLREAAQHFATAKRLKRIHEREGHPQAQALIQRFVDQGDDRLMWAQRFIDQTKSVVSGDAKIRYLRRSDGIPDLEVILENGQTISLSTGQMWDFPADPVPEFKKVAYLKTFFKDLRTVVGDLETDVKDLRAAFPR